MKKTIERYGYKNTKSSAGKGEWYTLDIDQIFSIKCWFNVYGNPSYVFHMDNGDTYFLVDDYGAMNGLGRYSRECVKRKKDLFIRW